MTADYYYVIILIQNKISTLLATTLDLMNCVLKIRPHTHWRNILLTMVAGSGGDGGGNEE